MPNNNILSALLSYAMEYLTTTKKSLRWLFLSPFYRLENRDAQEVNLPKAFQLGGGSVWV